MLKIIMGNKEIKNPNKNWIMYPEIKVGLDKIEEYLRKKAESKKKYIIYSLDRIIYDIGVLLYIQHKNIEIYTISKGKEIKIYFDDCGYVINSHIDLPYDISHKIMSKVNDIRIKALNGEEI